MSQTETHFIKMRRIDTGEKTKEQWITDYLKQKHIERDSCYEDDVEYFRNEVRELFYHKTGIYVFTEHKKLNEYEDINILTEQNGELSYITQFHNGGTCMEEMLEDALDKFSNETVQ